MGGWTSANGALTSEEGAQRIVLGVRGSGPSSCPGVTGELSGVFVLSTHSLRLQGWGGRRDAGAKCDRYISVVVQESRALFALRSQGQVGFAVLPSFL